MKVCPKCGRDFTDDVVNCQKDATVLELVPTTGEPMSDEQIRKKRKQDWLVLGVGIPAFMILLYGMYSLFAKMM